MRSSMMSMTAMQCSHRCRSNHLHAAKQSVHQLQIGSKQLSNTTTCSAMTSPKNCLIFVVAFALVEFATVSTATIACSAGGTEDVDVRDVSVIAGVMLVVVDVVDGVVVIAVVVDNDEAVVVVVVSGVEACDVRENQPNIESADFVDDFDVVVSLTLAAVVVATHVVTVGCSVVGGAAVAAALDERPNQPPSRPATDDDTLLINVVVVAVVAASTE
jgi:hypothetical protein